MLNKTVDLTTGVHCEYDNLPTLPTSGMAATARLTPTLNMWRTGLPWRQPTAMMRAMTARETAES